MKLLMRITFGAFVLGLLAVVLVSCGVISDERFRALPSWIQLLILACVAVSGLVTIADGIYQWITRHPRT